MLPTRFSTLAAAHCLQALTTNDALNVRQPWLMGRQQRWYISSSSSGLVGGECSCSSCMMGQHEVP